MQIKDYQSIRRPNQAMVAGLVMVSLKLGWKQRTVPMTNITAAQSPVTTGKKRTNLGTNRLSPDCIFIN